MSRVTQTYVIQRAIADYLQEVSADTNAWFIPTRYTTEAAQGFPEGLRDAPRVLAALFDALDATNGVAKDKGDPKADVEPATGQGIYGGLPGMFAQAVETYGASAFRELLAALSQATSPPSYTSASPSSASPSSASPSAVPPDTYEIPPDATYAPGQAPMPDTDF